MTNKNNKVMEAPEKIYFSQTEDGRQYFTPAIPFEREFVKYMPVNVFIEKAVSYLNSKLYDWVQTTNPNQRSYANTIMKEEFIEDFRNYMEGE